MSKIYEGGIKLTNIQVCNKLLNDMTHKHKVIIGKHASNEVEEHNHGTKNYRMILAHVILDIYKDIQGDDDNTMSVKKCLKHLMEKYMKSITRPMDGEDSAYQMLVGDCIRAYKEMTEE